MSVKDQLQEHVDGIVLQYGNHPGLTREEAAYFYIGPPEEVAPGVWHIYNLAHSVTFDCGEKLFQVDAQINFRAREAIDLMRAKTDKPIAYIAITHGHVDHCLGTYHYVQDNLARGYTQPSVIGHRNLRARIDKNKLLEGHRLGTDKKQFQVDMDQQDLFVYPDIEFDDRLLIALGDQTFRIVFGSGHTEDSLWVYNPERKVLACGDLFQWTSPNLGNPYKMQRFARENAETLEEMAAQGAEVLCPGHGPVIYGAAEIETCLLTAARYIHLIQDHVVACLNQGMLLEETVHSLKMPDDLMNSKYLPPLYGHPVFIAKGIYKRYAGYYTGHPAELFPPKYADLGSEVVDLAGGPRAIVDRVENLRELGRIELACQLAEWLIEAQPDFQPGWEIYGTLFMERAKTEFNMQARGAWNQAVRRAIEALDKIEEG